MTLPNPILGSMTLCVNFHCAPTQKRGFFLLRVNFKWGIYKMTPILGVQWHFGSIFTVNALKNHFFWPFFTINTLKIHFWGYFYVKNALSLENASFYVKNAFLPPNCWKSPLLLKKWPPPHFGSKWPKNDPPTPILGVIWPPRRGGPLGVKNGSKMTIFGSFFTIFSKKNPWISLLLFFQKKTPGFPYYFFSKKWPFLAIFGHFVTGKPTIFWFFEKKPLNLIIKNGRFFIPPKKWFRAPHWIW